MEWAALSLLAAFGQSLSWALNKKALNQSGVNNLASLVIYAVAASVLTLFYFFFETREISLSLTFWGAMIGVVILNILAVWAGYKAVDKTSLLTLMPFMSLTALAIVPIEYVLRGVLPTGMQIWGMVVVVLGAIIVTMQTKPTKEALTVAKYFAVTLVCYSITSPLQGVTVTESGSGLFVAAIAHISIALGFIPIVLMAKEGRAVALLKEQGQWLMTLKWMVLAGLVIALLENGPINIALESATASEVFALKRTMPFFALLLGVAIFKEKLTLRHGIGTAFLVIGSALIIWYR